MKYLRKAIEVEAVQLMPEMGSANMGDLPKWLKEHYEEGNVLFLAEEVHIKTLEGVMKAKYGDYVILGVEGEIYPCKERIFEKTYSEVK